MNDLDKLKEELGEEKFKKIESSLYENSEYTHLKTGNLYYFKNIVLDATNATEGRLMAVYGRSGFGHPGSYCREAKEFFEKFTPKFKEK